jgi:hypothetical protein
MIWTFAREGQQLRYEMTRDSSTGLYRLIVTHPDGKVAIEEMRDPQELIQRSLKLMTDLKTQGWHVT